VKEIQMQIVSAVCCLLMILFAAVQYNDPDALYWILIYGVAALWCGLAAFRPVVFSSPLWRGLLVATIVLLFIGVVWHWPRTPSFWRQEVWWVTETAREGMGMMIALFAVIIAWITSRKGKTIV
jgi:predicted membrane channel-forming protein YqfA (hemolysin III family)